MPDIVFRRGSTALNDAYVGPANSLSVDTDLNSLRLHNGSLPGGLPLGIAPLEARGGLKNLLQNGDFQHWPYGTTRTVNNSAVVGGCTRWQMHASSGMGDVVFSRQPDPDNIAGYVIRITPSSNTGVGYAVINQFIESVNTLTTREVTLSFDARVLSGSGVIAAELYQHFGTGGSPSAAVPGIGAEKFTLSSSFQRFQLTVQLPDTAGKTIGTTRNSLIVNLWTSATAANDNRTDSLGYQFQTVEFRDVMLESGGVETPVFLGNYPPLEIPLMERYTEFVGLEYTGQMTYGIGYCQTTSDFMMYLPYRTVKHVIPTVSLWSGVATDFEVVVGATAYPVTGIAFGNNANNSCMVTFTVSGGPLNGAGIVRNKSTSNPPVILISAEY